MKKWMIVTAAVCLGVTGARGSVNRRTPVVEAVEKALPSVVNIGTERLVKVDYQDRRRRLRGDLLNQMLSEMVRTPPMPDYRLKPSLGSGIIIDPRGYILTNSHVVERATEIRVTLADEQTYPGRVIASDEISDLALLKVDPDHPLSAIAFAKDDDLLLGETIIVLGNPFGLGHSVTAGVLSSKDREARYKGEVLYHDILQTDAAVNPGSSGGPLLNVDGELIGVNVAIYPGAQNIGFAVPVSRARLLLAQWLSPRRLRKSWVGIVPAESDDGLSVLRIEKSSPAAATDLQPGDIIAAVNGHAVRGLLDYYRALMDVDIGEELPLTTRRGPEERTVQVALAHLPKPSGRKLADALMGLTFGKPGSATGPAAAYRKGLPIEGVAETGPAAAAGLRPGLRVTRINEYEIHSLDDVGEALENVEKGDTIRMVVVNLRQTDKFILAQSTAVQFPANGATPAP